MGYRLASILGLVLLFLTACSQQESPPMRLATNIWPGYEPLYLAREKALFSDQHVQLIEFSSSSQSLRAFHNNLIDAAALTLDEALLLLDSNEDIRIVLVLDISNGADVIIAQQGITSLNELKGKRVGVENNALGAYVITRALDIAGLQKQDIHIVQLEINRQEQAFRDKRVDAVVTFEPVRSHLLKAGGIQIFDSSQIPGEIVDVLVVRRSYLEKYPEKIKALKKGWYQALAMLRHQPELSASIIGKRLKLDIRETLAAYQGLILPDQQQNRQLLSIKEGMLSKTANKLAEVMYRQKLLRQPLNPDSMFTIQ